MQIAAMICIQLERGIPEDQIRRSFNFDIEFDVDFQFYVDFAIEKGLIIQNRESRKYTITKYGREFVKAFLAEE
jgi:predicted transcriptional regulator